MKTVIRAGNEYSERIKYLLIDEKAYLCQLVQAGGACLKLEDEELRLLKERLPDFRIEILPLPPLDEELKLLKPQLLQEFKERFPYVNGWLERARLRLEGERGLIFEVENQVALKNLNKLKGFLQRRLFYYLDEELEVEIKNGDFLEDFPDDTGLVLLDKIKEQQSSPGEREVVLGGRIGRNPEMKLAELRSEGDGIIVEGRIFELEEIRTRKGGLILVIQLTDGSGSLTLKNFTDKREEPPGPLKKDEWIRARGSLQYDRYSGELTLITGDINRITTPVKTDEAGEKRVELHLHSKMSAMDSVLDIEKAVQRAAEWGHPALAVTDHGVVQAFPEAYKAGREYGVKIIYGLEAYLVDDLSGDDWRSLPLYHLVLLVRNQEGLRDLYRLVSSSHLEHFYRRPRILKSELVEHRENLLIGSACEAGQLYRSILEGKDDRQLEEEAAFYDYLEIMPLGNNRFLIGSQFKDEENLKEINRKLYQLGKRSKRPVAATGDVHFLDQEDEVFRRILQSGQGYDKSDEQPPLYYRTTREMLAEFEYLGEEAAREVVIENTRQIAAMIEEVAPIPEGLFTPNIEGAAEQIRELSYQRAAELYGDSLPEMIEKRLERELKSIIDNGFSVIYLIAHKLVKKSLDDGYLVGSRGSVGSSLVAMLCGITEVNPLPPHYRCPECRRVELVKKGEWGVGIDLPPDNCPDCGCAYLKEGFDIPFEVFMGFKGDKVPDIDLNFSGEYQSQIHRYTEELFGRDYVFRAGTISTIASRTAFGFVKGYLDDNSQKANKAEIKRLVQGCTGVRKTTGQHPGGLMVVPRHLDIHDFTPIQHPANDQETDVRTTHFDYHAISGRILKLDLLGHDDPTSLRMLQDLTGVDPHNIPLDDPETMAIFSGTESIGVRAEEIGSTVGTLGIPEFGTSFVRQMLIDTAPTTFAELVRISGLSHGTDVWLNNAQELIRRGKARLSEVISVRDDIMNYLIEQGLEPGKAFRIMENVRKGRGLRSEEEEYMSEMGVPEWYIDSCKKIKYMFPKAHAAAYVMMAYRIAYFKVHYPDEFYTTYFTTKAADFDAELVCRGYDELCRYKKELEEKGNDQTAKEKGILTVLEMVIEAMVRGVGFKRVDLYRSEVGAFKIEEKGLLPPLISLQGLGSSAAGSIVSARREGKFNSIEDLVNRTRISKTVVDIMRKHGSLTGLPEKNQLSLF